MPDNRRREFDFDAWAELARKDPEAFERLRADTIEAWLQQAPTHRQQRLRRLQWRIDGAREQADNPMAACIRLSQVMWDSVLGPGGLLENLEALRGHLSARQQPTVTSRRARVLEFPRHGRIRRPH